RRVLDRIWSACSRASCTRFTRQRLGLDLLWDGIMVAVSNKTFPPWHLARTDDPVKAPAWFSTDKKAFGRATPKRTGPATAQKPNQFRPTVSAVRAAAGSRISSQHGHQA